MIFFMKKKECTVLIKKIKKHPINNTIQMKKKCKSLEYHKDYWTNYFNINDEACVSINTHFIIK